LYAWDRIRASVVYEKFEYYIEETDPPSLEAVIQDQLANNSDLITDHYRMLFVLHPEIWS